jgi:hypothetical protein
MQHNVSGRLRRPRPRTITAITLSLAVLTSSAVSWADTHPPKPGDGTSAGTSAAPPKPAPAGFRQQLIDLYGQILHVAAAHPHPGETPPPPKATYAKAVGSLDNKQLAELYNTNPSVWRQLPVTLAAVPPSPSNSELQSAVVAGPTTSPTFTAQSDNAPTASRSPMSVPGEAATTASTGETDAAEPKPELEPLPALAICPGVESAFALLATSAGLQESEVGLEVAANAIEHSSEIIPVKLEIVSPGGIGAAIANPVVVVLDSIALGLDAARLSIEVVQVAIDHSRELIDQCIAANTDKFHEWLGEAVKALGDYGDVLYDGEQETLKNQSEMTSQIDTGFDNNQKGIANLQTSADRAQASMDRQFRERIIDALIGGNPSIDFELPASAGGYLDATPIGVRQITTDALAALRANGQPIDSEAPRDLTLANNALAAKQYKQAFHYYQLAYRAMARP